MVFLIQFDFFFFNKILSDIYKAPLHLAIEKNNVDIVQLLLSCENIDVNLKSIYEIFK